MPLRHSRTTLGMLVATLACMVLPALSPASALAARLDPQLAAATGTQPIAVVVTFRGEGPPDAGDRALLDEHGVPAAMLRSLPMAALEASPAQLQALARHPQVRSIWRDRIAARAASGATPAEPADVRRWSGRGVGVLVATPTPAGSAAGLERIAPGAEVIGFRTGSGSTLSAALGAFDYALAHQFDYNLRVVWNQPAVLDEAARGDPDHPLQVALRALAERGVLVVVPVPAGNAGSSVPWAIASSAQRSGRAPAVCGVLALMLEANPALTWREARDILRPQQLAGALDSAAAVLAAAGGRDAGGGAAARHATTPGLMSAFGHQPP